jgi:transposase
MKKNHILGMDIAQNSVVAQLDRADGTRCWRDTLTTDQAGWQQLETILAAAGARWAETQVLLEATGVYHLPWAERLHQGLRQLTSARARLRTTLTNLKKSLKSHLELVFPALLAAQLDPASARTAAILAVAPTAGTWRGVASARRQQLAGDKSGALDQACAATLADETLAQACAPALLALLAAQQALVTQLGACDEQIAPQLPPAEVALMSSVPGFGSRTAAVLAAYLPTDCTTWGNAKQITARLQAFFGLDPRVRQSGQWTGKTKLSKRGIGAARTALFQAAFCSLAHDPENAAYYRGLRARGKAHKQAMVDLMRKQLRRLVSVLRSRQPFIAKPPLAA